jgi:phage pi2 protein 07
MINEVDKKKIETLINKEYDNVHNFNIDKDDEVYFTLTPKTRMGGYDPEDIKDLEIDNIKLEVITAHVETDNDGEDPYPKKLLAVGYKIITNENEMTDIQDILQKIKDEAGWYCMDVEEDKEHFIDWIKKNAAMFPDANKAVEVVKGNDSWCTDNDEDIKAMLSALGMGKTDESAPKMKHIKLFEDFKDDVNKKAILRGFGFNKEVDRAEKSLCPLCSEPVKMEDFKDEKSRKEFGISGMCQKCQDQIFKEQ